MKLNFWQWLGLICVILGLIGYLYLRTPDASPDDAAPAPNRDGRDATLTDPAPDPLAPATQPVE